MNLLDIQKLQFSDKRTAEKMLLHFLRENEDPTISSVELRPRPESLNSLNGFLSYEDGERLFFKTHVEENEKLSEYYNAEKLEQAAYPIYKSKRINHRPGKQIALYEIIRLPTLFDLLKLEEDEYINSGKVKSPESDLALQLQIELDRSVAEIYLRSMQTINEAEHAAAPIHQLFYQRLSEDGRIGLFYRAGTLQMGKEDTISFEELGKKRWIINGVSYKYTLEQIIARAREILKPSACLAIVGHGDAHNGNIFVDAENKRLWMFDPAFAGLHSPLLDLVKPTFHNVFARWMYFPEETADEFEIEYSLGKEDIEIRHNYFPSPVRMRHLESRIENLIKPTLKMLKDAHELPTAYRDYLHAAFFCCPFLTVNLFAQFKANGTLAERYPLKVKMLALSLSLMFGSERQNGESELSRIIDKIFEDDDLA